MNSNQINDARLAVYWMEIENAKKMDAKTNLRKI